MKILMISTEYPPMQGGIGRYSEKLVDSLRSEGIDQFLRVATNTTLHRRYWSLL